MSRSDPFARSTGPTAEPKRYPGIYRAFVVDNQDPEGRGRLRLNVPGIMRLGATDWAEPCVPVGWPQMVATDHRPVALPVPPVGYPVWVMFEEGWFAKPVWMGTWQFSN